MKITRKWARRLKADGVQWIFFLSGSMACAQCVGAVVEVDLRAQILVLDGGIRLNVSNIVSFFEAIPFEEPSTTEPTEPKKSETSKKHLN